MMRKMVLLPAALALGLGACSDGQMTQGGRDTLIELTQPEDPDSVPEVIEQAEQLST